MKVENMPLKTHSPALYEASPLHALAYEIECNIRAARSHNVIHPELGKGHSNLIRFRSKDLHLHRLHYITSTNLGLCQSNMTYLTGKYMRSRMIRRAQDTTGCWICSDDSSYRYWMGCRKHWSRQTRIGR